MEEKSDLRKIKWNEMNLVKLVCQSKRIGWNDITTIRINKSKVILGKHIKCEHLQKNYWSWNQLIKYQKDDNNNNDNDDDSRSITKKPSLTAAVAATTTVLSRRYNQSKCLATIRNCISAWHFPLNLIRFFRFYVSLCVRAIAVQQSGL